MTTVTLAPVAKQRFCDSNGAPLAGGKLFFYAAGTTTKQNAYTDSTGATPTANPLLLDANGYGTFFLDTTKNYKLTLSPSTDTDPPTNAFWTVDNVGPANVVTSFPFAVDTGIVNALVATPAPAWTSYGNGAVLLVQPAVTNTGATTINVSGLGAKNIVNPDGSALAGEQLLAGGTYAIAYNNTAGAFHLISASTALSAVSGLINGDMLVAQRNTSYNPTHDAVTYGAADRWYGYQVAGSTGDVTISQQTGGPVLSNGKFSRVQRGSTKTLTDTRFRQVIESLKARNLAGQQVWVDFWARAGANYSPASSNLNCIVSTGTGSDEGAAGVEGGSWTGAATPLNQASALTTSWQRFTYSVSIGATVQEIAVGFQAQWSGTAGANDYFDVADVQIYQGPYQSPFVRLDYALVLAQCQRYAYVISNFAVNTQLVPGFGTAISTTVASISVTFPVEMRIAPTTATASAAANFSVSDGVTNTACTAVAISTVSPLATLINFTVAAGLTQYRPMFAYVNTATLTTLAITGAEL